VISDQKKPENALKKLCETSEAKSNWEEKKMKIWYSDHSKANARYTRKKHLPGYAVSEMSLRVD